MLNRPAHPLLLPRAPSCRSGSPTQDWNHCAGVCHIHCCLADALLFIAKHDRSGPGPVHSGNVHCICTEVRGHNLATRRPQAVVSYYENKGLV